MNSISSENRILIISFLRELSCCYRCIFRFLGLHTSNYETAFKNPKDYLEDLLDANHKFNSNESVLKKLKKNPCPVCLNCYDPETIENLLTNIKGVNFEEYNYNNFFFNVSFPKCLAVRAHSMYLHLKKNFPDISFLNLYDTTSELSLEQPHKIFRTIASDILSKALNRTCHPKANFSLLLLIGYKNDNMEVNCIKQIIKKNMKNKYSQSEVSRNTILEFLKGIDDEIFKRHFIMPPEVPEQEVFLEHVNISADSIYLGGRYLKFKRNVGQTPWVIDGVSVSEHNIQDIIFDAVYQVLRCNKNEITFTASGREDVDVRMLGSGRPFYIKIDNPKERLVSKEQLLEIERQIIKTELTAVIKLQSIYASEINRIKLGEEQKKKTYKALCKTLAPNIKEVISIINKQTEDLKITQLTVMRVLHRRTLLPREKIIHRMEAAILPEHADLFELTIITQAGTYVKEFVHGDFGRTEPSICSIVGYPTDIIALDCINIDLIWPEDDKESVGKVSIE